MLNRNLREWAWKVAILVPALALLIWAFTLLNHKGRAAESELEMRAMVAQERAKAAVWSVLIDPENVKLDVIGHSREADGFLFRIEARARDYCAEGDFWVFVGDDGQLQMECLNKERYRSDLAVARVTKAVRRVLHIPDSAPIIILGRERQEGGYLVTMGVNGYGDHAETKRIALFVGDDGHLEEPR